MIRIKEYKHDEPFHKLKVMGFVTEWNANRLYDRQVKFLFGDNIEV